MTVSTLALSCLLLLQPPGGDGKQRERFPFGPSLPQLTEKEHAAIERIIDRFIAYDVGKLKGAEGAKALADFNALGPEAIPCLIDGLNRAANLEDSCPAVLIAKKLGTLLRGSKDAQLLDYTRENVGAGVTAKRHTVVLKDLKLACQLQKSALQREAAFKEKASGLKAAKAMSTAELVEAAGSAGGERLKDVLTELEKRPGDKVLPALLGAVAGSDEDVKKHGRSLLVRYLGRQSGAVLKKSLGDERAEVRAAAARVYGVKGYKVPDHIIPLLTDGDAAVRQAARQTLVQLSKGQDFGPQPDASFGEIAEAQQMWRVWWEKQKK
jgi:hypothetical protein